MILPHFGDKSDGILSISDEGSCFGLSYEICLKVAIGECELCDGAANKAWIIDVIVGGLLIASRRQ